MVNLDPQLLSDYAFLHYNYKYDWLRLTLDEIITAYDWHNSPSPMLRTLLGKIARSRRRERRGNRRLGRLRMTTRSEEADHLEALLESQMPALCFRCSRVECVRAFNAECFTC